MEAFLSASLPNWLPAGISFAVHPHQGKADLLAKLTKRLRAYAAWLPEDWRVIVIVDRDDDDCLKLKESLECSVPTGRLESRSRAGSSSWQVVNRVAIEELEAWYFGDWEAVRAAYPKVSPDIPAQAKYRDPDAIQGGTWEAFERILKKRGYFSNGLRKIEAARSIGAHIDPSRNRSRSFSALKAAIDEACA